MDRRHLPSAPLKRMQTACICGRRHESGVRPGEGWVTLDSSNQSVRPSSFDDSQRHPGARASPHSLRDDQGLTDRLRHGNQSSEIIAVGCITEHESKRQLIDVVSCQTRGSFSHSASEAS